MPDFHRGTIFQPNAALYGAHAIGRRMNSRYTLAANAGLEPALTGSKPVVLPLHQSAIKSCSVFPNRSLMFCFDDAVHCLLAAFVAWARRPHNRFCLFGAAQTVILTVGWFSYSRAASGDARLSLDGATMHSPFAGLEPASIQHAMARLCYRLAAVSFMCSSLYKAAVSARAGPRPC